MRIRVGHLDWTVVPLDPASEDYGECSPSTHTIGIHPDSPPQEQAATLIHEIIHACFVSFGLPGEPMDEETICLKLEGPLTLVLRDNPQLPGRIRRALLGDRPLVKRRAAKVSPDSPLP